MAAVIEAAHFANSQARLLGEHSPKSETQRCSLRRRFYFFVPIAQGLTPADQEEERVRPGKDTVGAAYPKFLFQRVFR